jgi:hypothetical protein
MPTNGTSRHDVDADVDLLYSFWPDQAPPTPPLPEAPVSITLKASLHGYEALVTLRGHDFASVQAQVEQASQWLRSQAPAQPPSPPQGTGQDKDWCPIHQVRMKETTKDGRTWLSHKTDQGWCKGRR